MSKPREMKLGLQEYKGKTVNVIAWFAGDTIDGGEVPIPIIDGLSYRAEMPPQSQSARRSGFRDLGVANTAGGKSPIM